MCENKAQGKKKKLNCAVYVRWANKKKKKRCVYENNSIQMQAQCCKNTVHLSKKKKNMEDVLSQKKKKESAGFLLSIEATTPIRRNVCASFVLDAQVRLTYRLQSRKLGGACNTCEKNKKKRQQKIK